MPFVTSTLDYILAISWIFLKLIIGFSRGLSKVFPIPWIYQAMLSVVHRISEFSISTVNLRISAPFE